MAAGAAKNLQTTDLDLNMPMDSKKKNLRLSYEGNYQHGSKLLFPMEKNEFENNSEYKRDIFRNSLSNSPKIYNLRV